MKTFHRPKLEAHGSFLRSFRWALAILTTARLAIPAVIVLVSLGLGLGGCAHEIPVSPTVAPPVVHLGPELDLLRFRTSHDWITTFLDKQGYAHVLVAAAGLREVHQVVISPDGEVRREVLAPQSSASSVSAAFDSADRLHALIGGRHLVRESAGWTVSANTPWAVAGLEARQPRLVQGPDGLVWAFLVKGKEVGAKGRWDWYVLGGAYAAIVVPWHSDSEKLVIVPETGATKSIWYVVDPQDNRDARNFLSAMDDRGNLSLVYASSRTAIVEDAQPRYVQIRFMEGMPQEAPLAAGSHRATRLYPVSGKPVLSVQPSAADLDQAAIAVDPESGKLLLVRAHQPAFTLEHGAWSPPLRLPLSHFWEPRLAPAGGGAFHMMTVDEDKVLYLLYTSEGWSAPVEIGRTKVAATFGAVWDALAIASAGQNRAFLVWPTDTGIVGRWVQGVGEIESKPRSDLVSLGVGITVPKSLVDFADGKAALVTPGWTSGLTEAAAAGFHSSLAKQLHDEGQWESLASLVLNDNYGDDLRWYFLGRAAEGMALCDAAETYFKLSKERSGKFATRCKSIGSGPCGGFNFPHDLEERFRSIEVMRAAGKCLTPSPSASAVGREDK